MGLAAKTIAILTPFVSKSVEEYAKKFGEAACQKSISLLGTLKKNVSGDKEATEALENFKQNPGRYKSALEDILSEKLANDKNFANQLQKVIGEGPEIIIDRKIEDAKDTIALEAKEMTKGRVFVKEEIKKANGAIGVKIDHIGDE